VFTSFGCTDSTTQTITVVPSPRADFRYQLDGQTKTVAFTGQSTAGAISDWYWEFGDGNIATGTQPSHTYAQAGSYAVTLVITADTRCRSVVRKTIQVFDPPQADFALPATLCAGAAVTLADNTAAATGDPVTGWQWQVGEQTFTNRSPAFTVAPGAAAVEVTLTVTTATVAPVPQARFSHEPFAPLQPLQIRFTNASEGAVRYQWNFGDGQTSDAEQPVHAYAGGGLYTVTLTTTNASGCSDTAVQSVAVSAIADAYELKLEGVRVTTVGRTSSVQVRLLNKSTKTLAALSFNFTFNESRREVQTWRGQLGPGTTLNHSFQLPEGITASDIASLCVWAKDEGSGTASNRACITPNDQFVLLNPAPNPARQQYRLAFILPQAGDARVEMTDALGRTVLNKTLRGCRQGYNEQVQPVVHLANGFYIIRLFYAGQVQTKPLLVD
jgi:PKD repeat protein